MAKQYQVHVYRQVGIEHDVMLPAIDVSNEEQAVRTALQQEREGRRVTIVERSDPRENFHTSASAYKKYVMS